MKRSLKSKANVLIVFIMTVSLAYIVFSFISLTTFRVKESRINSSSLQAFYVAEAGLNKAVWMLATPISDGGGGVSYRTTGVTSNFGLGRYTYRVYDTGVSGQIAILSTGEVGNITKTVYQLLETSGLPPAFNYSIFGNSNVSLGTTYNINGSMFVNGNTVFSGSGTNVTVYHTSGKTVTGGGVDGGVPAEIPTFPVLDTSYYANEINISKTYAAGNATYNNTTVNLGGGTLYVNGDATFSTVNIVGPGKIVASGNILFSNGPNTCNNEKITVISGSNFSTTGNNTRLNNFTYYGQTSVAFSNSYSGTGNTVLSNGNISTSGNVSIAGMLYSKTGAVSLSNSTSITGSIVAAAGVTAVKTDLLITYDKNAFSGNIPPGFPVQTYAFKRGSWKML